MTEVVDSGTLTVLAEPGRPAIVRVPATGDAPGWARGNAAALSGALLEHGALLLRGLGIGDTAGFAAVVRALSGEPMVELEGIAKRDSLGEGIYSSSEWSADLPMCMHHERSYSARVPARMVFGCLRAPETGGVTGISDARRMLSALPADLVERFERHGWLLTRNYNAETGVTWSQAFGTTERAGVEKYCRDNGIAFQWRKDGSLRTRQKRSAIVAHPETGERCWFNQIAFLNRWTLDEVIREFLILEYGENGLPFDTSFGNGDPIGADIVQTINDTYEAQTRREPWQAGDILLVDNVLAAHSRDKFTGQREVVVALADEISGPR